LILLYCKETKKVKDRSFNCKNNLTFRVGTGTRAGAGTRTVKKFWNPEQAPELRQNGTVPQNTDKHMTFLNS
jgi:hypothetical protein